MRRLAYLFPAFPVLHQTFTLGEVLGLKRKGYDLRLISLKGSSVELQQDEARPLIDETLYCPRLLSTDVMGTFARALLRRPVDVLRLFGAVLGAWQRRDTERRQPSDAPAPTTLSTYEKILAVYHSNAGVYLLKSMMLVPYAIWISERLRAEGIEHVHSHWATYPTTVAFLIRRWSGIPYSFTAHAYDIYMNSRMLASKIECAEFVVTCADTNRRYLTSLCDAEAASRVRVNYHGTDLGRFSPVAHERGETFRVMSCGWLKEYKGFHVLVEALALLVERGIDAQVDIAGDGPQRSYLEKLAAERGVGDRLILHGYLGHERLRDLYRGADVFALPSIVMGRYGRQDVIPNVLAEAMAVGVPAVGTEVGGVPELIDSGVNGIIVPERDPKALADALAMLWEDAAMAKRLGRAGREKVELIWDRDANLDELAIIIDKHVSAPAGAAADAGLERGAA